MKHFMRPLSREATSSIPFSELPISSPNPNPNPSPNSQKHKTTPRKQKENSDPQIVAAKISPAAAKFKSPLPPRPPPNPLKRKLYNDAVLDVAPSSSSSSLSPDSGVRVVVRMRPLLNNDEKEEMIVQKISNESLSSNGHTFTFDSVADAEATQLDIFQCVGAPLVENCLAGFNSSVFAYGQTGSGKTFTMWGPANALLEGNLVNDQQGLTPRVFERLFTRINEEQIKHSDRQLKYQCRCSFLEIYNEQITDLLDPRQKNLQIREDTKTGVYVENLTEESVSTMKDVIQLLLKGLANRRTGATSINAESSRSHSVFTCVVESHCKNLLDGLSNFKSSRINLVDLAGSERQRLTGAAGERLKEAGNINRSLSQLGNLINILAEISQTGKQRHIPYRDSRLTFLLQESLGGNAKLAMICAISPAQSCKSETFSTLRFAQRAKAIKNKAVVNEVMQNDVNFLREVIKQLKDELIRMKAHGNQTDPNAAYANSWIARRSLGLLKFSLNHPMALHHLDNDGDEVMEIDEETVQKLCDEVEKQASGVLDVIVEEGLPKIDSDNQKEIVVVERENTEEAINDIVPCDVSFVENSTAPTAVTSSRKSPRTLSKLTASLKDVVNFGLGKVSMHSSYSPSHVSSSHVDQMDFPGNCHRTTERLAASLHHGLEILENNRRTPAFRRSTFRRSFNPIDLKPILPTKKVDVGIQTMTESTELPEGVGLIYLCSNCKNRDEMKEANDTSNLQLVPVDTSLSAEKRKNQVPKAVEKVLTGAIRREMALEDSCAKQASEIAQLNRLVQQYKHERECNAIIAQLREDKIIRLENLMDGVLPSEDFMEEELACLRQEHELLKEKYENHPEVLRTKIELQRAQDELERLRRFFNMGERDVLVEEIQDLRNQLQYYTDSSPKSTKQRKSLLKLTYPSKPSSSPPLNTIPESVEENAMEKVERERAQWEEVENKWISLAEELKAELESSNSVSEKLKQELEAEKECTEEHKEAMRLAMQVHARMIEQYADLEERHMQMLANQRRFHEGVDDIKKAAARAGVKGAESRFINALATEISSLRVEREKERRYWRDEIKMLQAQLTDTAEAVQAAGELLVCLKEAEEAFVAAERRAAMAEQAVEKSDKRAEKLKRKHEIEINELNKVLAESQLPKESIKTPHTELDVAKFDEEECHAADDVDGDDEQPLKFAEPSSWFSGYDKCNI